MKIIDCHTHISSEEYANDRNEVLSRALEVCDYLIDIGAGMSGTAHHDAKSFAEQHSAVYFTSGVHPHDAHELGLDEKHLNDVFSLLTHPKCVALGECGLDYFYENSPIDEQRQVFQKQINEAQRLNIPLMIHTRDAESDTKEMLKNYNAKAMFHCFTGTKDLAHFGVDRGFMISFSGIVTFKKAEELRDCFLSLPLDHILIETDAPFLAPVPMRGKRNESSFISHTAQFLADLRKMPVQEFIEKTSDNALRFFSKIARDNV